MWSALGCGRPASPSPSPSGLAEHRQPSPGSLLPLSHREAVERTLHYGLCSTKCSYSPLSKSMGLWQGNKEELAWSPMQEKSVVATELRCGSAFCSDTSQPDSFSLSPCCLSGCFCSRACRCSNKLHGDLDWTIWGTIDLKMRLLQVPFPVWESSRQLAKASLLFTGSIHVAMMCFCLSYAAWYCLSLCSYTSHSHCIAGVEPRLCCGFSASMDKDDVCPGEKGGICPVPLLHQCAQEQESHTSISSSTPVSFPLRSQQL